MSELKAAELLEVVGAEIRLFDRLFELVQQEQRAIVADDRQGLEASVGAQQQVAEQAQLLEGRRRQVVERLSRRLAMNPGQVRLERLIEAVKGESGAELARMRQTLLELCDKIRSVGEHNAFLIRQSMRYTERCLDILTGQPARGMYGKFGKARQSAGERTLLNQTA